MLQWLPFAARGRVPDADGAGKGASCLLMAHETPRELGFALCLPLTEREPLFSGGLVSSSTIACGFRGVNANAYRPVDDAGDKSGALVDGRRTGCGQPGGRLGTNRGTGKSFGRATCSEASGGAVDRKKLR